ncbi:hypothetical protein AYI68_g5767 [Smittium mucronatum]|uniref:Kinetochore protein mis14 n=1 Tax=Smittium mucronatum TaxID=133383 RepID=A0A1R0GTB8_9FUNG|nr:hypothetical protein AYI68_g5767 [Smittium mucronatum]
MSTEADIPKIRLDSREDVQFVKDQVWQQVGSNCLVNGLPYEEVILDLENDNSVSKHGRPIGIAKTNSGEFEPFDEKLDKEVLELTEQADQLLLRIAQKRRQGLVGEETAITGKLSKMRKILDSGERLEVSSGVDENISKASPGPETRDTSNSAQENSGHNGDEKIIKSVLELSQDYTEIKEKIEFLSASVPAATEGLEKALDNINIVNDAAKIQNGASKSSGSINWSPENFSIHTQSENNSSSGGGNTPSKNKNQTLLNIKQKSTRSFCSLLD